MVFLAVGLWLISATILSATAVVAIRLFCKCACCGRLSLARWKFSGERYCPRCAKVILADVFDNSSEASSPRVQGPSFLWDMSDAEIAAEIERFKGGK